MADNRILKPGKDYPGVCVVFFCHDGNGQFVMARRTKDARNEPNTWDIGGGEVEIGVSKATTLCNEIHQEYGVDVVHFEEVGSREVMRPFHEPDGSARVVHWYAFDFIVEIPHIGVHIGEPHKFSELDWFTLESLPPNTELYGTLPDFLRKHNQRIREILNKKRKE